VILFPDLADAAAPRADYGPARAITAQAQGQTTVGLLGSLDHRKGIGTLLEVARQARSTPYFFAMVGQFSRAEFKPAELRAVMAAIKAQPANCFFHLDVMPREAEFNAVINTFDIVFAAYLQFPCSSNMLAKAALFRKPLIVSDGFYMAEQVRRYGLGLVVPEGDPAACLAAIATLVQRSPAAIATMEQGMAQYLRDNSFDRLLVGLDRLLGHSTQPHPSPQ
jgi:glycosyltransferase involved in cell wall biosynthesis